MGNQLLLLVEDEPIITLTHKTILEKNGYRVITAPSGEKAIPLCLQESPDLILMDIDLGKNRMDGCDCARAILKETDIPIVFLTSHNDQEMVDRVKGITRYGYVLKSSGTFVLLESIQMAFELFESNRTLKFQADI